MLEILSVNELRIERELGMPRAFLVRISDSRTVQEVIVKLRSYPEVESAEPNRLRRIGPPLPPFVKPAPNG
jgi:cell division protein FtsX